MTDYLSHLCIQILDTKWGQRWSVTHSVWWEAQPTDSRHSPATSRSCLAGMASSPPSTASFLPFVKLFCKQDQTNSAHKRLPLPSRLLFNQLPCFLQNLETLRWHPWKDSNMGEGAARGGQIRLASIDIDTQKMVWIPTLSIRDLLLVSFLYHLPFPFPVLNRSWTSCLKFQQRGS